MLTILDQLDQGSLWQIPGGIHPPEMKSVSNTSPIGTLPLFDEYLLPLPQVGEQATLAIKVGDLVLKGQRLTHGAGLSYMPVHAPTSGEVIAIEPRPSNHASALPVLTLVLKSDGKDTWWPLESADVASLSHEAILSRIQQAGVAGMGGAAFPSRIKLAPASEIDLVIVNGVECEPYITADDRLMRQHADDILAGLEIVHKLLSPKRLIIAIEDNKPEAAAAMTAALIQSGLPKDICRVTQIPTKYPSGGEKQLIQIITGKEVPSGAIPAKLGIVVHNVGTLFAIRDAVALGKPLIERVVTVTGNSVSKPGNYWAPIGTKVTDLLSHCEFTSEPAQKIIMGGPMMGYTLPEPSVPILKGSNCILVPASDEIGEMPAEKPCIRCGECAVACPASLLPQQLFWHSKAQEYDKAESYNLKDCIECGCCSYVCPSDIPLVEYYRVGKAAIRQEADEKRKAEQAKVRFEARIARLEFEKNEREAKAREAAEKRKASMVGNEKDAIAAALARVQAKKAAKAAEDTSASQTSDTTDNRAADTKAGVAAAVARAKAKKAQAQANALAPTDGTEPDPAEPSHLEPTQTETDSKKAAIAAAIARAKAKKAMASTDNQASLMQDASSNADDQSRHLDDELDPKKAAIAAAIARAKARKAAQSAEPSADAATASSDDVASEQASNKQVPREHAQEADNRHADEIPALSNESIASADNQLPEALSPSEAKKAAIAAAVAKAKAKKAAQQAPALADTEQSPKPEATQNDAQLHSRQHSSMTLDVHQEAHIQANIEANIKSSREPSTEANREANKEAQQVSSPALGADAQHQEQDSKKARIAAAVAKAKAKKAAREQE